MNFIYIENTLDLQIEPNVARVNIPDERFNWLKGLYHPKSEVPAFLEVVDIAGENHSILAPLAQMSPFM